MMVTATTPVPERSRDPHAPLDAIEQPERPLRRDAAANRERVLAAAVAMFARQGREVSMAAIAEAAGVGVGTLYRRYPTRDALLSALTERSFELALRAIQEADDPAVPAIAALGRFFETTVEHRHELLLPLHGGPTGLSEHARSTQRAIRDAVDAVLDRGRRELTVRDDVTAVDIITFGALLAHTLSAGDVLSGHLRRQAAIYLAGLAPAPERLAEVGA
ncbi:TetR/AcrR family transcriptional regulator [Gordonia sp. NPDC003425]